MADEKQIDEVIEAADAAEAALATGGVNLDNPEVQAKLQALRAKLGGAVNPPTAEEMEETPTGETQTLGRDVDWSEYDLNPEIAHHYPNARLVPGENGNRWVVDIVQFRVEKEPVTRIARIVNDLVNGPEGWRMQSPFLPGQGSQVLVTLQRIVSVVLPTPNLLRTEGDIANEITQPTDEELKVAEEEALKWAATGAPPEAPLADGAVAPVTMPTNDAAVAMDDFKEAKGEEYQPRRENVIPGAIAASKEFHKARESESV